MWQVNSQNLMMTEGDFGIQLPVTISGTQFAENDAVKFVIKSEINGDPILEKEFTSIQRNTVNLVLTEAESALLPVGTYIYNLDWYSSGSFMCNIIRLAQLKVVEKA